MSSFSIAKWLYEQRYLHSKIREFGAHILAPNFKTGHKFQTDFFGLKWAGTTNNHVDFQVLLRGAYEKFMLFFIRDIIVASKSNNVVLDIGSNIGNHALFMSLFASTVHAFEPYPPVRDSLVNKIELNRINNIVVHPFGLSDKKESIPFYPPRDSNTGTGSFDKEYFSENDSSSPITLEVATGDDTTTENNIGNIGLIKIDVEGFELQALAGLHNTLRGNRPVVIFESLSETREHQAMTFEVMANLFPENYAFYAFSLKNKKNGNYKIFRINDLNALKSNEIIAIPQEKVAALTNCK